MSDEASPLATGVPALLSARALSWAPGGQRVVGPLDLDIGPGEAWFLIGPNGAGKTSLLRLLAGLLKPATGEVRHRGAALSALPRREIARRIAYVPQLRPLSVPLDVETVVLSGRFPYFGPLQWSPSADDRDAVTRALDTVGLQNLRRRRVDQLSGGERQGVYIAAALAQDSEILLLDEPTTHLDPRHQRDVVRLLEKLHRDGKCGLIVATHDLGFAAMLADSVLALSGGRDFARGAADEILVPALLERLFEAPFSLVEAQGRSVPALILGSPPENGRGPGGASGSFAR